MKLLTALLVFTLLIHHPSISQQNSNDHPVFHDTTGFYNGFAKVSNNQKWGVINKKGKLIVPVIFDYIDIESEGCFAVKFTDYAGYLDTTGKVVVPLFFDYTTGFKKGYGNASKNGEKFRIYRQNSLYKCAMLPADIAQGALPDDGGVRKPDEQDGYFLPPYQYESDLLSMVVKNGKVGFIDHGKKLVIPFNFELALPFSAGMAAVYNGSKWGFINRQGQLIIPFRYDRVLSFQSQITKVWMGDSTQLITNNGTRYQ